MSLNRVAYSIHSSTCGIVVLPERIPRFHMLFLRAYTTEYCLPVIIIGDIGSALVFTVG